MKKRLLNFSDGGSVRKTVRAIAESFFRSKADDCLDVTTPPSLRAGPPLLGKEGSLRGTACWAQNCRTFLPNLAVIILSLFFVACAARNDNQELNKQAAASNLWISVQLSTNNLHIGEIVSAEITVKSPLGTHVILPSLAENWVLRDQQEVASEISGDWQKEVWLYKLTSFSLGQALLASGSVQCVAGTGVVATVVFPSMDLTVASCLSGTNLMFQDIRELPVPKKHSYLLWLVIAALLVLGLAVLAWYRRRAKGGDVVAPTVTPQELALQALAALQERGLIEAGACDEFYVALSAIARRYIEERFGLRAAEQTTEEFMREAMRARELTVLQKEMLGQFLEQCDLVKFARHQPQSADMRQAYAAAERFVRETTPLPPEEPAS